MSNNKPDFIPLDTKDLIPWLEKKFPVRCVKPEETLEEANRYAGKCELINHLKLKLKEIEEESYKHSLLQD